MSDFTFSDESYPHSALTGTIIKAALHVHRELGYGFLEAVYRRALAIELRYRAVPSEQEVTYELPYRLEWIGTYRADLVASGQVIVECKTGLIPDPIGPQLTLNYLKASKLTVGLFIHFGPKIHVRRVVFTHKEGEAERITKF